MSGKFSIYGGSGGVGSAVARVLEQKGHGSISPSGESESIGSD